QKVTKPDKIPFSNGCGTAGFSDPDGRIVGKGALLCCNKHDICYSTCSKSKEDCDSEFMNCLDKNSGVSWLKGLAEKALSSKGCEAYKASQAEYCTCTDDL
ncbi:phospholipase A2 group XII-like protein, partial [Leptotrombidium deliense]